MSNKCFFGSDVHDAINDLVCVIDLNKIPCTSFKQGALDKMHTGQNFGSNPFSPLNTHERQCVFRKVFDSENKIIITTHDKITVLK